MFSKDQSARSNWSDQVVKFVYGQKKKEKKDHFIGRISQRTKIYQHLNHKVMRKWFMVKHYTEP